MAVLSLPGFTTLKTIIEWCVSQCTWRNAVFIYVLFNLKSAPFSWHVRLFFHLFRRIRWQPHVYPDPKLRSDSKTCLEPHLHPIFMPAGLTSRAPLWETDYNCHKSNSTYFSDLDIARTVLVTNLYTPGFGILRKEMDTEVDEDGKPKYPRGRLAVMLGSVHCTFKKEIKPYERYEMQSKVAGWDEKWMYVLTFFLRPEKRKGEGKTLLAVGVSKYVTKKGRLTIRPEKVLRASGLLPPRPDGEVSATVSLETPASGEAVNVEDGLEESALREVLTLGESTNLDLAVLENDKKARSSWDGSMWTWEKIEQERLRGLEIVQGFINMDAKLYEEAASVL
ncbi:hypothetical protein D8B26_007408 [Coccidioides posadasii str. Silveira]|uniref:Uncharacterized protein n=3 Tax=Coccidioides posadasii TaxID=199306 RepID=E9CV03_COCPS|nr:hypothetical protein CPC735_014440 [Coccidioides posadasii C735 delta SOWgp]EER24848.1 hypothetical protein CPC735_014440 [Coccidioides posadasii C735 delta SOWgp]EFW21194.1 conserved hypothetical protein [Coccidioides posadasii str. Silveira]KMM71602.1 hypothetical protein CPAG_07905 [Coccidioides posadasii RMSCC 3488]QVM12792.1 hypothetical protein D8B26_007408 [Coccidioides posadasii str. Silveira]|eukprot:XP_003066993.1 hypothetical protein CPC735_014440 [Coccidioides posadasii C735 delta SOWgp]